MNIKFPLILSLSIHIIFILVAILLFPENEIVVEDEIIKVDLVFKKEEVKIEKRNFAEKSVEIVETPNNLKTNVPDPLRDTYIDILPVSEPDLVILNNYEISDLPSVSNFNSGDFENALEELMPIIELDDDSNTSDSLNISWDGEVRDIVTSSYIDFSSFPKSSFTGVGVTATFVVNPEGVVYDVKIIPPGSGSTEFDLLVEQYVRRFKFKVSDKNSKGEVIIVYKK